MNLFADDPAFPISNDDAREIEEFEEFARNHGSKGLTKYEFLLAHVASGVAGNPKWSHLDPEGVAGEAIDIADAIFNVLNKRAND